MAQSSGIFLLLFAANGNNHSRTNCSLSYAVTINVVGAAISRPVKIVPIFTPQRGSLLQVSHFAMQNGRAANSRPYSTNETINYNFTFNS